MGVASKKLGIQPIWGSKKRNHRCFFWGDVVHGHAMYTVTNHMILFYVANNMVPCFLRSASIMGRYLVTIRRDLRLKDGPPQKKQRHIPLYPVDFPWK
jgi:hypothetical protein